MPAETINLESPAFFNVRDDTQNTMPDAVQAIASQPDPNALTLGGLFNKLIDTGGDILAQRESNRNQPLVGSVYPTGQVNPGTAAQDLVAERNPATTPAPQTVNANNAAQLFQFMPWIIGGVVVVVIAALAFRARGK